jgi:hypothetical protein
MCGSLEDERAATMRFDVASKSSGSAFTDPSITDEMWIAGVRQQFKGRVVVGADLMEID